jgi:hypothetical protein
MQVLQAKQRLAKHQLPNQISRAMSVFETASDACLANTAKWMAKKMMLMSWDERNRLFEKFDKDKPKRFMVLLSGHFSPDDLLRGIATGMPPLAVVVLPNKRKLQASIEDYFTKRAAM